VVARPRQPEPLPVARPRPRTPRPARPARASGSVVLRLLRLGAGTGGTGHGRRHPPAVEGVHGERGRPPHGAGRPARRGPGQVAAARTTPARDMARPGTAARLPADRARGATGRVPPTSGVPPAGHATPRGGVDGRVGVPGPRTRPRGVLPRDERCAGHVPRTGPEMGGPTVRRLRRPLSTGSVEA